MNKLLFSVLLWTGIELCVGEYLRPCYYTNWAQYRQGKGKFFPEDIEVGLCTHIVYAFGWLNEDYTPKMREWNDEAMIKRVNALKQKQPELKTLLSFGGWTFPKHLFEALSKTPATRKTFIQSTIAWVRKYDFDGIDVDWEYPTTSKANYAILMQELRDACEAEAQEKARLLVTAAVAAGKSNIDAAYDIPKLAKSLDFLMVMSYDFHGSWEQVTGHNSPLETIPSDPYLNTEFVMNYYAKLGFPKNNLLLGIGTYGRGWKLANAANNGVGASAPGKSTAGPFTGEGGYAAYYELCDMVGSGAKVTYDTKQNVPYLVNGDQWFSYDNEQSVRNKMKYVKNNGFGGAFVWALDLDDFHGTCTGGNKKKYPLIGIMKEELSSGGPSTDGTTVPTPEVTSGTTPEVTSGTTPEVTSGTTPEVTSGTTPEVTSGTTPEVTSGTTLEVTSGTTPEITSGPTPEVTSGTTPEVTTKGTTASGGEFKCPSQFGLFPDPQSCSSYYQCNWGKAYKKNCPSGTEFNPKIGNCDWPANVDCQV